jgi:alanyl-tRNA synthetase
VRRIECFAGIGAEQALQAQRSVLHSLSQLLKCADSELGEKVERLIARGKQLERELDVAKGKLASSASGDLAEQMRTTARGIKVIVERVDGADTDTLRAMVDRLRVKIGSGVVALAGQSAAGAVLVAGVTPDLVKTVHAGNLVKEAVKVSGGKGGGRPDFAQAGGVDPERIAATLEKFYELVSQIG